MAKCRWMYGSILFLTLVFLFCFGNRFLLFLFAGEIVILLFLWLLVKRESRMMAVGAHVRSACVVDQETFLTIDVKSPGRMLAAGFLEVTLEFENLMFKEQVRRQFRIPLSGKKVSQVAFQSPVCGEIRIRWSKVICYDVFGLCRAPLEKPGELLLTVHPKTLRVQVNSKNVPKGSVEGERFDLGRKGSDIGEVYDLREYRPGDDVRSIHWKLSSKMDSTFMREGSDTSHYDVMLLFDAGLTNGENRWNTKMLSAAIELFMTVSMRMLELGIPHYTGIFAGNDLRLLRVAESTDHLYMMNVWMGLALPEKNGTGIRYFLAEKLEECYSKLIYITAGDFSNEIYQASENLNLTALCVREGGEKIRTTQRGNGQMMEVPLSVLSEHTFTVII